MAILFMRRNSPQAYSHSVNGVAKFKLNLDYGMPIVESEGMETVPWVRQCRATPVTPHPTGSQNSILLPRIGRRDVPASATGETAFLIDEVRRASP